MKSLRLKRHWSQEQLAHLSGLNVRTIQRVEKGQSVGTETLKSLASVFEISIDELKSVVESEKSVGGAQLALDDDGNAQFKNAQEKVQSIRYFYGLSALLILIFLLFMLPNYNDGENTGSLVVVFLSFTTIIVGLGVHVFQPFGEEWERERIARLLARQKHQDSSRSE